MNIDVFSSLRGFSTAGETDFQVCVTLGYTGYQPVCTLQCLLVESESSLIFEAV